MTAFEAPDPATSRRSGVDRRVLGLVLVGVGILWFVQTTHVVSISGETLIAVLLMLLGGGLLLTARSRQRLVVPVAIGVVLTLALVSHSGTFPGPRLAGVGAVEVHPLQPADLQPRYHDGVGNLVLDLTQLPPAALDRDLKLNSGVGTIRVLVPPRTDVAVDGNVGAGKLTVCGVQVSTGLGIHQNYDNHLVGALSHLRLQISHGVGNVEVDGCQPASGTQSDQP